MKTNYHPLIILTGKTASGKDTVMAKLLNRFPVFKKIITTTSRLPRYSEQDQIDYNFISKQDFENKIKLGEFIEYVEYGGNLYGTEKAQILKNLQNSAIWRIDPSRAGQIKEFIKNNFDTKIASDLLQKVIVIYLTVDETVILERLKRRGLSEEEIKIRMEQDKIFWDKYKDNYNFVVENIPGQLENTLKKIIQIIQGCC